MKRAQTAIDAFRALFPALMGDFNPSWRAGAPDFRAALRAAIAASLPAIDGPDRDRLADLRTPPQIRNWSVSIAHSPTLGGWLATAAPSRVGLDIEDSSRIRPELIGRICGPEEIRDCPEPPRLWPAKEAVFKSLVDWNQPATITEITTTGWSPGSQGVTVFRASVPGLGAVREIDGVLIACFLSGDAGRSVSY